MKIDGRSRLKTSAKLVVGFWLCFGAHAGLAQDYVQPPCPSGAAPQFEDHLQSLWYGRFWTGDCKGLPALGCRPGRPYWNDVVRSVTARAAPDKRVEVSARVCGLGRRIGFEWTRPKAERRINTQDLQKLNTILDQARDVNAGLFAVEETVKRKTGS